MTVAAIAVLILAVAVAGALWRVGRSAPDQSRQIKVLRFMLYFWLFVFIQLVIAAIGYVALGR